MTLNQFKRRIEQAVPVGTVFENPGGGTSKIAGYSDAKISYVRGTSKIYVTFKDLFAAYSYFKGQRVSASDLQSFAPAVFDSSAKPAGHACNCTFLFLLLRRLNLAGEIEGSGVRGSPYAVKVHDESTL